MLDWLKNLFPFGKSYKVYKGKENRDVPLDDMMFHPKQELPIGYKGRKVNLYALVKKEKKD